jgi:hypothetical protein
MTADDKKRKAEAAARQQEAASKKSAADAAKRKKDAAAAKSKKEAAEKKKAEAAAATEKQRVKDMFLQPGETQANTSPFASPAQIKKREAVDAVNKTKELVGKYFPGVTGGSKQKTAPGKVRVPGMTDWNNMVDKYSKKKGGSVKKSMYTKRKK